MRTSVGVASDDERAPATAPQAMLMRMDSSVFKAHERDDQHVVATAGLGVKATARHSLQHTTPLGSLTTAFLRDWYTPILMVP